MPTSSSGWTAPEALNRSWPKTEKGNKPMAVVSSHKDDQALTLTFVAEFDASVERVWQVWQDPRQLERWWGPPTWPATFEPTHTVVTIEWLGAGSRMTMVTKFANLKQLERVLAMGGEEGMRLALGQVDAVLAGALR